MTDNRRENNQLGERTTIPVGVSGLKNRLLESGAERDEGHNLNRASSHITARIGMGGSHEES